MIKNPTIVPTKVIDNFLTNEEINIINAEIEATPECRNSIIVDGVTERIMENQDFNNPAFAKTKYIIETKMKDTFGDDLYIGVCNVLNAFVPYRTHTDGIFSEFGISDTHYGAYTCVLPLDNYNSNTFIFNEYYDKSKLISDYVRDTGAGPQSDITPEIMKKYFTHEDISYMKYMSIETIFPWKKGSLLAASRYKFHTSDDFPTHGVPMKRAIIMWTAYPLTRTIL
jgi:hypothetical protein